MKRPRTERSRSAETLRAGLAGLFVAGLVMLGIYFGSRRLKDFDTALVSYAAATVFSAFGLGYRYSMWLYRPPTLRYWRRGFEIMLSPRRLPGNLVRLAALVWNNLLAQNFIRRRSVLRWTAHACMFWGCILAGIVTFPLSFGWIRFETPADSQEAYDAYVFGVKIAHFALDGAAALMIFNILVLSAILVLAGVFLTLWRRARDPGELATQDTAGDLLPLILLFAISSTGLLLSVSARFLHGFHYVFLSQFHAVTVIFTLLYLPFGKFFHIFQRPAQLSLEFYRRAGREGGQARCTVCNEPFATALHIGDLKAVQAELNIRFDLPDAGHYQDVCPSCRRKNLALLQDGLWRDARSLHDTR